MSQLLRRRFFAVSVVILLALVVLSNSSPRAGGQTLQGSLILNPQIVNIMQGYGFNMNVTLQDVTNLGWFGTYLDFNTSRVSMQTYAYRDGWSGGCMASSSPHEGLYCSGVPPGESFTGSAVVLTIAFKCENAGSSQISVSSSPGWLEHGGSTYHDFAVTQGATVNQAAPVTVTVTTTSNVTKTSAFTTISTTTTTTSQISTAILTSWGYVTLPRTTTITSLITSLFTSVITTTSGSTVTNTLTSVGTTTISATSTVTSVTTVASPITITETAAGTQSSLPPSPPHCVIATAVFGSALAPEVVYMRYVRDQLISSTPSGRMLVGAFNAFYYSWSPALAESIAESALSRAVFRVLLVPLVGIVHVTALVFEATAHATGQTDAASLLAFLAAAAMTIAVYVALPVVFIARSRQVIRGLRTRRVVEVMDA